MISLNIVLYQKKIESVSLHLLQVLFLSQKQWEELDGKCGVCGDAFDGIRENEAGGIYATGTIGRNYTRGQVIKVQKTRQLPLIELND